MDIKSLGVVGSAGKFGTFLIERVREHLPGLTIVGYDSSAAESRRLTDVFECDAIVFAVPPCAYEAALRQIVPQTKLGTIIIDICTVKVHTVKILREIVHGRPYIAMHPMFGPQSYRDQMNSLKGLNLIVCEKQMLEGAYISFERFLANELGLKITHMSADAHDEMQAVLQLLPQYIGCVVNRAGFTLDRDGVHTVSGQHFFRAMEIVKDDFDLFRQASQLNPYWPKVLARYELADAQHNLEILNGTAP